MKKAVALFLTAIMLFGCAAQGEQIEITWAITPSDQAESGSLLLTKNADGWLLTSGWLGDYAVRYAETDLLLPAVLKLITDGNSREKVRSALSAAWSEWTQTHTGKTGGGLFSGDAFDQARQETVYEISLAELSLLISSAAETLEDEELRNLLKGAEAAFRQSAAAGALRLICRLYDEGRCFSVSVNREDGTVLTLSGKRADSRSPARLVAGWGETRKNYYFLLESEKKDDETLWQGKLLADDGRAGFRSLGEGSVICSWNGTAKGNGEAGSLDAELLPDNGSGPFRMHADRTSEEIKASLFMGENSENPIFSAGVRTSAEEAETAEGKTLLRFGQMSKEEENTLRGVLYGKAIVALYRMIQLLPEEMTKVILPQL